MLPQTHSVLICSLFRGVIHEYMRSFSVLAFVVVVVVVVVVGFVLLCKTTLSYILVGGFGNVLSELLMWYSFFAFGR